MTRRAEIPGTVAVRHNPAATRPGGTARPTSPAALYEMSSWRYERSRRIAGNRIPGLTLAHSSHDQPSAAPVRSEGARLSEPSASGVVQVGGDASRPAHTNGSVPVRRISAPERVLLLDTDVAFRQTLVSALDRFGIEVSWHARVLGLFDALAEADPVALVMSADLPGSDPLELIRSLRRSRWAELPVLVVANEPDRSFQLRAYVDGADTVLERAGSASELSAHIIGYAARRQRRRQSAARDLADDALALSERPGKAADTELGRSVRDMTPQPVVAENGGLPGSAELDRGLRSPTRPRGSWAARIAAAWRDS